jgi:hypothetical protein
MRWCAGDTRIVRRFLFSPLVLRIGGTTTFQWRWLEWARIEQMFYVDGAWHDMAWAAEKERVSRCGAL